MTLPPSALLEKYLHSPPPDSTFFHSPCGSRIRRSFHGPEIGPTLENDVMGNELFQWIGLMEAIEGASGTFTVAEFGAGYGRWLVAAAVAMRKSRNLPVHLVGVEAEHAHFEMMRQHFLDNDLDPADHILVEAAVAESDGPVHFVQGHSHEWWGQAILPSPDFGFGNWPSARVTTINSLSLATVLHGVDLVDLIDMDIQGAEAAVARAGTRILNERVRRIHIGTHNAAVEAELADVFNGLGWTCRANYPCFSTAATVMGEIEFEDGVQIWINPTLT